MKIGNDEVLANYVVFPCVDEQNVYLILSAYWMSVSPPKLKSLRNLNP